MAKTVSDILIKFKEAGTGDVANAFKRITRQARDVESSFKRLSGGGIDRLRRDLDSLKKTNVNIRGSNPTTVVIVVSITGLNLALAASKTASVAVIRSSFARI